MRRDVQIPLHESDGATGRRHTMNEHDDDLEPEVEEGAEIERQEFPILDEEDEEETDDLDVDPDEVDVDPDESEL
jgi:hypothetical protein